MDDLISRQAAIDAFYPIRCKLQMMDDTQTADKVMHGLWLAEKAIEQLPSAQSERKKGEWITQEFGSWAECSECHELYDIPIAYSNFCPNCGADMRTAKHGTKIDLCIMDEVEGRTG